MISAMKVIKELDFVRLSGTAGEKKAVDIICKYIREAGSEPVIENFDLNSFEPGKAIIKSGEKEFTGTPYGLNKSALINGELVWLDHIDMIRHNRGKYRDKIVMSYGFSRGIAPLLRESGVAGYIGAGSPGRKATSLSHRQSSVEDGYIHSLTVSHETGLKLKKLSGQIIEIEIEQKTKKAKAYNIVVDIAGKGLDETLTIAGGHLDSVAHSPGASDNGGGIVSLLKIIEHFNKRKPARDLRIVFFGGEELGLLGSQNYVKQHLEEIKNRLGLMFNIDVSGDDMAMDRLMVLGSKDLLGYADGLIRERGYLFRKDLGIYSSDCMPFAKYEIPSINLARSGGKASRMIHTSGDNFRNVSKAGYENTIMVSIYMLERILDAGVYPVSREIDDSLREKIEKYLWNLNYREPKLEWEAKYKK